MGLLSSDLGRELRDVYEKAGRRGAVRPSSPDFGEPPMVVLDRPVSESTVGLLVSRGARAPEQLPLAATNDLSFQVIPQSVPLNDPAHQRDALRATLDIPVNTTARHVAKVPLTYQQDGGRQWVEQTYKLYRDGAQVVLDDAVAHGKIQSLAGQEDQFSIRCSC